MDLNQEKENASTSPALNREQLFDLALVPEFGKKFNESQKRLHDRRVTPHMGDYIDRKEYYKEELYYQNAPDRIGEVDARELFWFELTRYSKGDWRLTGREPNPPINIIPQLETVPHEVIKIISKCPLNPEKINTLENIQSKFYRKTVTVNYVRLTEGLICGTIIQTGVPSNSPVPVKIKSMHNRDMEMGFRKFHYYLENSPELVYPVILAYLKKKIPGLIVLEKPLLDIHEAVVPGFTEEYPQPETGEDGTDPDEKWDVNLYDMVFNAGAGLVDDFLRMEVEKLRDYEVKEEVVQHREQLAGQIVDSITELKGEIRGGFPVPRFVELNCWNRKKKDWGIRRITPMPDILEHRHIFPPVLRDLMAESLEQSGKPATFKIYHKGTIPRWVKYRMLRLAPNHVVGTVIEHVDHFRDLIGFGKTPRVWDLFSAYRVLEWYLEQNKQEALKFIAAFINDYAEGKLGDPVFPMDETLSTPEPSSPGGNEESEPGQEPMSVKETADAVKSRLRKNDVGKKEREILERALEVHAELCRTKQTDPKFALLNKKVRDLLIEAVVERVYA